MIQILGWAAAVYLVIGFLHVVLHIFFNVHTIGFGEAWRPFGLGDALFFIGLLFGWVGIWAEPLAELLNHNSHSH